MNILLIWDKFFPCSSKCLKTGPLFAYSQTQQQIFALEKHLWFGVKERPQKEDLTVSLLSSCENNHQTPVSSPEQEVRSTCLCWPTTCCRRCRRFGAGTAQTQTTSDTHQVLILSSSACWSSETVWQSSRRPTYGSVCPSCLAASAGEHCEKWRLICFDSKWNIKGLLFKGRGKKEKRYFCRRMSEMDVCIHDGNVPLWRHEGNVTLAYVLLREEPGAIKSLVSSED